MFEVERAKAMSKLIPVELYQNVLDEKIRKIEQNDRISIRTSRLSTLLSSCSFQTIIFIIISICLDFKLKRDDFL